MVRTTLAGLVLATLLSGCVPTDPRACTKIGAESGVSIADVGAVLPDDRRYRARACVDARCAEAEGARAEPFFLTVGLADADVGAGDEVTVSLTITALDAADVVFSGTGRVELATFQPNGEGCPPVVYQARLRPTADGTLVPA